MASKQAWLENNFRGGYADDKFVGTEGSFQSSKGLEIRKAPANISVAYLSEKKSASVVTDLVRCFVTIESTGDVIAFGDAGKIYRKATGQDDWVNCYTDTGAAAIIGAYEYNGNLVWATSTTLHKIAVANIDASWSGDVTEDWKTFTNGNTNQHPMIEINNNLYIGDGSSLAELDSSGTFTGAKISLFGDDEIRALTFASAFLRIFARKSTKVDYGRVYYWNMITDSYSEAVPWPGLPIHAAINRLGIDYVLAGRRPRLYASSGQFRQVLKVLPDVTEAQQCFISNEAMATYNDLIVFGPADANATGTIGRGIWTWGALSKDYPEVLNFDFPTSNDTLTETIGAIHSDDGDLYQSWKNGASYGIDKINTAKYKATGEVITRVFRGDPVMNMKRVIAAFVSFSEMAAGEKIELYLRKDLGSSWGNPVITVDYDNDTLDRSVSRKILHAVDDADLLAIGDFNFLEAKIVLTTGSTQTTSPKVMELGVVFDSTNDII